MSPSKFCLPQSLDQLKKTTDCLDCFQKASLGAVHPSICNFSETVVNNIERRERRAYSFWHEVRAPELLVPDSPDGPVHFT